MIHLNVLLQDGGIIPRGTQQSVFHELFWVFTALGVIIGAAVIGYLLWKAYQYRASRPVTDDGDVDRPRLGQLPSGSDGGRHLLVSFSISGIIVIALIAWTYGSLLYVAQGVNEHPPTDSGEQMDVTVVGHQFYWEFQYHNVSGHNQTVTSNNELRVPRDALVRFRLTSADVFHNFGIPKLKVKADAIPGQNTTTWLVAEQKGTYTARCYELCGQGHSYMTAKVIVMEPKAFDRWYAKQTSGNQTSNNSTEA